MESSFDRLPPSWQRNITRLRKDCKIYRLRLRAAEAEIAALRAELEAGRGAE